MAFQSFMYPVGCCEDGLKEAVSKKTTAILLLAATLKLQARLLKAQLSTMIIMRRFPAPLSQAVF